MARAWGPVLAMLGGPALMLLLWPATAAAQTPSPLMYWQYSAGEALAPLAGELPEWRVAVGASATVMPEYDGAQRYRPTGGPFADIQYDGRYFASSGEGIGVNVVRGTTYRAGIALSTISGATPTSTAG